MRLGHLLILFAFLKTLFVYGQAQESRSFELEWEQVRLESGDANIRLSAPLVKGQSFDGLGLPLFSAYFNVQNNSIVLDYQINNVKFSTISSSELTHVGAEDLPSELEPVFKVTRARENSLGVIRLNPLIQENGQVKKVLSFTLSYRLGTKRNEPGKTGSDPEPFHPA